MELKQIYALSFSPVGSTRAAVCTAAEHLSQVLGLPWSERSFTLPEDRNAAQCFTSRDLVLVGSPTYAGGLPNKILPDFRSRLRGAGTPAVALVTFGNRAFDNSLAQLGAVLSQNGFLPVAGAALVCRHVFSGTLAAGRPDEQDRQQLLRFLDAAAKKLRAGGLLQPPVFPGSADAPYYVPLGLDGAPARFLKAVPVTDPAACLGCGLCARHCPMSAIDPADPARITGTCIKCHSCVRRCPVGAKGFDDPAFLSHAAMLEQTYSRPAANAFFL